MYVAREEEVPPEHPAHEMTIPCAYACASAERRACVGPAAGTNEQLPCPRAHSQSRPPRLPFFEVLWCGLPWLSYTCG